MTAAIETPPCGPFSFRTDARVRFKGLVLKTSVGETLPGVRIPLGPLDSNRKRRQRARFRFFCAPTVPHFADSAGQGFGGTTVTTVTFGATTGRFAGLVGTTIDGRGKRDLAFHQTGIFPSVIPPIAWFMFTPPAPPFDPRRRQTRQGAAAVEFAILLPVLLLIVFGAVDVCTMIRTQQRLNTVAFESARIAATPDSTMGHIIQQCQLICKENRLVSVSLNTDPVDFTEAESGDWIEVTAAVPFDDNSLLGGWVMPNLILSESVSLQIP